MKIDEIVGDLSRLSDKKEEVNWHARYNPNHDFARRQVVKIIYTFLDGAIRNATYQNIREPRYERQDVKALVPISGGIDSATVALLAAETIRHVKKQEKAKNTSLVLLGFNGLDKEEVIFARRFADHMQSQYPDLNLDYQERDLMPIFGVISKFVENIGESTHQEKIYGGEVSTCLIDLISNEVACRIGHCKLDSVNKIEVALGEFNLGGESNCSPLLDFYKSRVYDIAEFLGAPKFIIDRHPINSSYGTDKIKTYFREIPDEFGPREVFAVLDPVLHSLWELGCEPEEVVSKFGHDISFVRSVKRKIDAQNHRRKVPFFVITDRTINFRTPSSDENRKTENNDFYNSIRRL